MNLVLVGLNHHTAPIDVRERLAVPRKELHSALHMLKSRFGLEENMIISTCNRVEVVAAGGGPDGTEGRIIDFFCRYHDLTEPQFASYLYRYESEPLVRHIFRVASSLDSMVVGESQILGQVKDAFRRASLAGVAGTSLQALFSHAFFVAKRVRRETGIADSPVSVSSVAIELAEKIFGGLNGRTSLLFGAGKMGELAARRLSSGKDNKLFVVNRTADRAAGLATRLNGQAVPVGRIAGALEASDIVIVSTGADSYLITRKQIETIIRRRRYTPLFIIDISVPRNVDPAVNQLDNVFLYDIDDLKLVVDANLQERSEEAKQAERIVDQEVGNFLRAVSTEDLGPLIRSLRNRLEDICLQDFDRAAKNLPAEEVDQLRATLLRTAHRIAHPMITELKTVDGDLTRRRSMIDLIKQVFDLDD